MATPISMVGVAFTQKGPGAMFKFGQMTDTHLYGPWDERLAKPRDQTFPLLCDEVAAHGVDFIVNTGDLCGGGSSRAWHERFKGLVDQWTGRTGIPYHVIRGNHDAIGLSDQDFAEVYGSNNWCFEHKGFVMLGIDRYAGWQMYSAAYYAIAPETLDWLETQLNTISTDTPIVLLIHDNPIGITDFHGGETLMHMLAGHNLQQILVGHTQGNWVTRCAGIPQAVVVGEGQPFDCSTTAYNIVTCHNDGTVTCDFHPYLTHTPPKPKRDLPDSGGRITLGEDWSQQRGHSQTRHAADALPGQRPTLAWRAQLDGEFGNGGATLLGGTLVIGTRTKGRFDQCVVAAFDAASGEPRWNTPVNGSVEGAVHLHDGRAYAATTAGSLYCLDLADGSIHWHWNNRNNVPIICEPILDRDDMVLHFGGNSEVYAVDARSGDTRWRRLATADTIKYFSGGAASPVLFGQQVIHARPTTSPGNPVLQSFNKADGSNPMLYQASFAEQTYKRHASPIIFGRHIFSLGMGVRMIYAQSLSHGVTIPTPSTGAMPAADRRALYVNHHNGLARYDLLGELRERWFLDHPDALYHYSGTNELLSFDGATPPTGNFAAPLTDGQRVVVANTAGQVMGVEANRGAVLWTIQLAEPVTASPTCSGNGLFVADQSGTLYAFAGGD